MARAGLLWLGAEGEEGSFCCGRVHHYYTRVQ